ncbi:Hypothetical protein SFBmNL_00398 [Candidatus Arthromitus sp. SFB-mouse-NL]|uniref:hypothetical protein n=1 Tax=Candidatus Arthromitus sp. SFB-mouse-NL TaxID=1508644 RepID=UPI00049A031C|nr:hypothetical protein [Candidatus Arthromitus sp. SFB-mouse-NL]AID44316.1 Hypothetical protein SFBmNL_00398 [Candidatus Arthromitus sp. SFB-mouse-NL]
MYKEKFFGKISTSNISERVSGSKDIDGIYSIVDDYVDLGKTIIDKSKGLLEDKKKAFDIINGLDDNMHRIVLIELYFNSEPWKSIDILFEVKKEPIRSTIKRLNCVR